jgi:glycosyltransferase involved in cell wall biosynthesis
MIKPSLITVIIPMYNAARYLAEAIESVLAQSYRPIEVIVVDDGSTDSSAEIAKAFGAPVRLVSQPQSGVAAARNTGVALAQGDFLAFLDADDLWLPGKLTLQIEALQKNPQVDAIFSHIEQFHSPELEGTSNIPPILHHTLAGYSSVTMLVRRHAFLRVGPFDPSWEYGEFIDWYARAQEQGVVSLLLPEVLVRRRIHTTNFGILNRDTRMDYPRVLKAALDRRKKGRVDSEDKR